MYKLWRDVFLFGGAALALVNAMVLALDFAGSPEDGREAYELANSASGEPLFAMAFGLIAIAVSCLWR
ncbi:hypothetical protein AB4099_27055 [Bosea sp. 2KB_26]|uniref:hypothetical protein n=1 Tax=Bosea sp. 2KB_26 TaxID=3237475 RepID=UPI003F8F632E